MHSLCGYQASRFNNLNLDGIKVSGFAYIHDTNLDVIDISFLIRGIFNYSRHSLSLPGLLLAPDPEDEEEDGEQAHCEPDGDAHWNHEEIANCH